MKRKLKNLIKSLFHKIFIQLQKIGITVLPYHFYSQVPDISFLKRNIFWKSPLTMNGVNCNSLTDQIEFIDKNIKLCQQFELEDIYKFANLENGEDGGFGEIESIVLFSFIISKKPQKIIQIGCGVSTSIILRAVEKSNYKPEIICIDPFPTDYLIKEHNKGKINLRKEMAQLTDIELFKSLNENDLLFIDSTHTVKVGSEVNRIVLEILPIIKKGIYVHFHDIYFPYDYKRDTLSADLFFWSESTLLHSFLILNDKFKIISSLSMLHYYETENLKRLIPIYNPQKNDFGLKLGSDIGHFPSSIYLKTLK